MFLKHLQIKRNGQLVRSIPFKKGINLIIDETKSSSKTSTGNGVGKTTVLRLIDYCLDGSDKNIYIDPEFKTKNNTVETFLKGGDVLAVLTLKADLNDESSPEIVIERNFLTRKKKIQKINGEKLPNKLFSKKLKELIFENDSPIPSFRQLKSKNIRDEKNKVQNTIRVLAPNVITDATYEVLHLFWFGVLEGLSKDKLIRELHFETKIQTKLKKETDLSQIIQSLDDINVQIEVLELQKKTFGETEVFSFDIESIDKIRSKINALSTSISCLQCRRDLINESCSELEATASEIDLEQVSFLYNRAKTLVPNLQKTFEQLLCFHNGMIDKKISFLQEELPDIEKKINEFKIELSVCLENEAAIASRLKKNGIVESLQAIVKKLSNCYEKKGMLEEQRRSFEKTNTAIEQLRKKITEFNANTFSKDSLIQEQVSKFNTFFTSVSDQLDGVISLLRVENVDGIYKFSITNSEGNPGMGGKKSQMASFDIAYIKFADSINLPCLHFILQDQIENVHSNQITSILTKLVVDANCQYVLPVLRDKLPVGIDLEGFEILKLSQDDKLFKL